MWDDMQHQIIWVENVEKVTYVWIFVKNRNALSHTNTCASEHM